MADRTRAADQIILGDAAQVLPELADGRYQVIYVDPPFHTGQRQTGASGASYEDSFGDFRSFIVPLMIEARRLLRNDGTLYFHIDQRESHYCKVWLDEVFGRENFLNKIIWAYDFGGRGRSSWPRKHDSILVYTRSMGDHHFDQGAVDRIPYMSPGWQSEERLAAGKLPTDVWWQTIVPTRSSERTGYPTQKPVELVDRALSASASDGEVLDFCAGSGTAGVAAKKRGLPFTLIDSNPEAIEVMRRRLTSTSPGPLPGEVDLVTGGRGCSPEWRTRSR